MSDKEQTMVERVAEALKRHAGSPHFEDAARAAIEVLRAPSAAMIKAAYGASDDLVLARFRWEAMINAALAEEPKA